MRLLEDEVNQAPIVIDRALQGLNDEINRQSQYVATERTGLVQISHRHQCRTDIRRIAASCRIAQRTMAAVTPTSFTERRALVVIRFDKPDVAYEPALYQALSRALERRPDAVFDLEQCRADSDKPATPPSSVPRRGAEVDDRNGLAGRSRLGERTPRAPSATTPEVHIYVQ